MTAPPDGIELLPEASDPATSPARLVEIAQEVGYGSDFRWPEGPHPVREALARNPSTPPDVLHALAGAYPDAFLENPVAPLMPLESRTSSFVSAPGSCWSSCAGPTLRPS